MVEPAVRRSAAPGADRTRGGYQRKSSQFIPKQVPLDLKETSEDERINKKAARVIVRMLRKFRARRLAQELAKQLYEKHFDYDAGACYYVNRRLGTSSWTKPMLLGTADVEETGTTDRVEVSKRPMHPVPSWDEMRLAAESIWGTHMACLRPINVYEASKPVRFLFRSCRQAPGIEDGAGPWQYCFSFFAFVCHCQEVRNTLRFVVSDCTEEYHRSQIASPTSWDKTSGATWEDRLEFHAFHEPTPGTVRINVQQVSYPTRFRVTEQAAAGYWMQRFHFYAFPATRYNVQHALYPHRYLVVEAGDARGRTEATGYPEYGWRDAFSFYAFDLSVPGTSRVEIQEQTDANGVYRHKIARVRDNVPSKVTRSKVSSELAHSGWTPTCYFYAFDVPVLGTTRIFVQIARRPERYRLDFDRALKPWTDLFSFYAYASDSHLAHLSASVRNTPEEDQWLPPRPKPRRRPSGAGSLHAGSGCEGKEAGKDGGQSPKIRTKEGRLAEGPVEESKSGDLDREICKDA